MTSSTELSPAAAYVLLDPGKSDAWKAMRLALLWLLALGVLRFEETSKVRPKLYATASPVPPLPPHIAPIVETVRAAEAKGGFAHDAFKALGNAYGPPLNRLSLENFKREHVLPALVAGDLLREETRKVLGLFTRKDYQATPDGEALRHRLRGGIDHARRLPELLANDPADARATVAALGSAILLIPELEPYHARIAELLRGHDAQPARGPDGERSDGIGLGALDAGAFATLADRREAFDKAFLDHFRSPGAPG